LDLIFKEKAIIIGEFPKEAPKDRYVMIRSYSPAEVSPKLNLFVPKTLFDKDIAKF
ncbi:MAG: hypothetical protein HQK54_06760, partial [Oligoflexales bacterium]|nr:hypothetical protein [Oligoflexales bacterium]